MRSAVPARCSIEISITGHLSSLDREDRAPVEELSTPSHVGIIVGLGCQQPGRQGLREPAGFWQHVVGVATLGFAA